MGKTVWEWAREGVFWMLGALWGIIAPAVPLLGLCFAAKCLDVVSAVRRTHRVVGKYSAQLKAHPDVDEESIDGKVHSQHLMRVFESMLMVFGVILVTYYADMVCGVAPFDMSKCIAWGYVAVQVLSVLENESACKDGRWARVLRHYVTDKTKRELGVSIRQLEEMRQAAEKEESEEAE